MGMGEVVVAPREISMDVVNFGEVNYPLTVHVITL